MGKKRIKVLLIEDDSDHARLIEIMLSEVKTAFFDIECVDRLVKGDGDAAIFVLGMIAGAALSHNFGLASSPKGVGPHGIAAVIIGILVCLIIGFAMRKK